mgnify:CR=1 FL=1
MPDNRPCQLSRKHHRVFGIIFSHFPSPPRRSPLPFFFRFLKCQTHRFSQSVRPIFPSFSFPPRRQTALSSFFASLNAKHTASLSPPSPSAQFFPAFPLRHAGKPPFLSRLTSPHKRTKISLFHMKSCFFREKIEKNIFNQASFDGLYGRFLPNIRIHCQHLYFPCP